MLTVSVLIFIAWLILNAKITLEVALFGLLIVLLVNIIVHAIVPEKHRHRYPLSKAIKTLEYIYIVVVEVIKANIDMIKIVLFVDEKDLVPSVTTFKTDLKGNMAITALTSSITLTPGTITVAVTEDELMIHALDIGMLEGIDDSIFVHKLRELEGNND